MQIQLEQQHTTGLNQIIGKYKSHPYVKWKSKQPSISPYFSPPVVDLYLHGSFQKGITTTVEGDTYNITSTDRKTQFLKNRYGEQILGLSDESKNIIAMKLKPYITAKINKILT
jgi:hypothetical protein